MNCFIEKWLVAGSFSRYRRLKSWLEIKFFHDDYTCVFSQGFFLASSCPVITCVSANFMFMHVHHLNFLSLINFHLFQDRLYHSGKASRKKKLEEKAIINKNTHHVLCSCTSTCFHLPLVVCLYRKLCSQNRSQRTMQGSVVRCPYSLIVMKMVLEIGNKKCNIEILTIVHASCRLVINTFYSFLLWKKFEFLHVGFQNLQPHPTYSTYCYLNGICKYLLELSVPLCPTKMQQKNIMKYKFHIHTNLIIIPAI